MLHFGNCRVLRRTCCGCLRRQSTSCCHTPSRRYSTAPRRGPERKKRNEVRLLNHSICKNHSPVPVLRERVRQGLTQTLYILRYSSRVRDSVRYALTYYPDGINFYSAQCQHLDASKDFWEHLHIPSPRGGNMCTTNSPY